MNTLIIDIKKTYLSAKILKDVVSHLSARIHHWQQRQRTRRALKQLSPQALTDIGLSRTQAMREAEKPFWQ